MKLKLLLVVVFAVVSSLIVLVHAQKQRTSSSSAGSSTSSGFDDQGIKNYLLGPGDVLRFACSASRTYLRVEIDSDGNLSSLPFLETPIPS